LRIGRAPALIAERYQVGGPCGSGSPTLCSRSVGCSCHAWRSYQSFRREVHPARECLADLRTRVGVESTALTDRRHTYSELRICGWRLNFASYSPELCELADQCQTDNQGTGSYSRFRDQGTAVSIGHRRRTVDLRLWKKRSRPRLMNGGGNVVNRSVYNAGNAPGTSPDRRSCMPADLHKTTRAEMTRA